MNKEFETKYANVLLSGVNLQKGQNLLIRGEPIHAKFAGIIAEEAYKRGARYVRFDNNEIENPYMYEARIKYSNEEYLAYVPQFRSDFLEKALIEKWALIAIRTPEDPDFLEKLDTKRNAISVKAIAETMAPLQRRVSANEIAWLVAFMPTEKLAAKIMNMEPNQKAVEALWKVLIPILHLDLEDPASYWILHGAELANRAAKLNSLKLTSVRFEGPGTDLTIGLSKLSKWNGGPDKTKDGIVFCPNIPTEEVFTSPDSRLAEGKVRFTRPVLVPTIGKIVEDGELEFKNGEVVSWNAKSGKDVLDTYFAIDPGAKKLGEVALVDGASPIFKSGVVFYNILFDENASCHIALGSCYPSCYTGGDKMTMDELIKEGGNNSSVHTDFMIGGPSVSVYGKTADGKEIEIIKKGTFVI